MSFFLVGDLVVAKIAKLNTCKLIIVDNPGKFCFVRTF